MCGRLNKQLEFLIEADKMKSVLRQTLLADGSKRENDAEHSWHFALMAMVLYEYADQTKVDLYRVLKMALVHDLVEVYAGDTFAYDDKGNADKEMREAAAAQKLFRCCQRISIMKSGICGLSLIKWKRRTQDTPRRLTGCSPS